MRGYPNKKEYPDWTVEKCTCYMGHPNPNCSYKQPGDEDLMIKGIYSRYADKAEDSTRLDGYFT